ncbi:hypothetical protein ABKN59_011106 [Abortiporus biennis]
MNHMDDMLQDPQDLFRGEYLPRMTQGSRSEAFSCITRQVSGLTTGRGLWLSKPSFTPRWDDHIPLATTVTLFGREKESNVSLPLNPISLTFLNRNLIIMLVFLTSILCDSGYVLGRAIGDNALTIASMGKPYVAPIKCGFYLNILAFEGRHSNVNSSTAAWQHHHQTSCTFGMGTTQHPGCVGFPGNSVNPTSSKTTSTVFFSTKPIPYSGTKEYQTGLFVNFLKTAFRIWSFLSTQGSPRQSDDWLYVLYPMIDKFATSYTSASSTTREEKSQLIVSDCVSKGSASRFKLKAILSRNLGSTTTSLTPVELRFLPRGALISSHT